MADIRSIKTMCIAIRHILLFKALTPSSSNTQQHLFAPMLIMKTTLALSAFLFSTALAAPHVQSAPETSLNSRVAHTADLKPRQACVNGPSSRRCWGQYSIDTNWYTTIPNTGVTREYWLTVMNVTLSPDGVSRRVLTFNGTIPGPTIVANWGDHLIIHVTNTMTTNGTSIHWHGLRQFNNTENDGVPGVTQCPIAPGHTYTYRMQATQYGSTWYHSHFITQYGDGLQGGMVINGPATANYDVDLGILVLQDWAHQPTSSLWDVAKLGGPPTLDNGLINGTNTFNGLGKKFQTTFVPGKKYLIRLLNSATDGHFQFSIDGHNLTVIANDLVPLVPYQAQSVKISMGQRYDIIVEATQKTGNFWIRGGWLTACSVNANPTNITGIVRYGASTADPTTVSTVVTATDCGDEPYASLVPHLAQNVGAITAKAVTLEDLSFAFTDHFIWVINSSSLVLDWTSPTIIKIFNDVAVFPTPYNVVALNGTAATWAVYVIQDLTGIGLYHPIHMHGHDFFVVGQEVGSFALGTSTLNLINPPRRDVATLPGNGYLAIAFQLDNPGSWLLHCHIAWHASEGLSMQFVENQSKIALGMTNEADSQANCAAWSTWSATMPFKQDDSGI